jgi:STE24 endopeptidase
MTTIEILIYGIIIVFFVFELWLSRLNYKNRNAEIPEEVNDIYDKEAYQKWLNYTMENHRFSLIIKTVNTIVLLVLLFVGFKAFDSVAGLVSNEITQFMIFLGLYMLVNLIVDTPFNYYLTFTIEEKYGFNKTSKKTFWLDSLKSLLLTVLIGGGIIIGIYSSYVYFTEVFIIVSWIFATIFILVVNIIYVPVIVPIFNKLTPLEDGDLKDMIQDFAHGVGYEVTKISTMDASKRSTKLNAFFAGLGKFKQVVLYDTLVEKMSNEEIVAVLAHEIGHSKHKHIIFNLIETSITLLFYFGAFYLVLAEDAFMTAFSIENATFGFAIILFLVLMNPISIFIGLLSSYFSRKHEYQADAYAATKYKKEPMITALKVLSKANFSNLTPHPLVVKLRYSHPPTAMRIKAIKAIKGE